MPCTTNLILATSNNPAIRLCSAATQSPSPCSTASPKPQEKPKKIAINSFFLRLSAN